MREPAPTRARRYCALTVVAVLLVALAPQAHFLLARGRAWHGEVALAHGDEVTYAAYLNALIEGRPRRNDPYTGRDDTSDAPQAESYFSIQFVPPLVAAFIAHLLRLDASRTLIIIAAFAALACALTLCFALNTILRDARLAAAGTLATLFLASTHQVVAYALRLGSSNNYVPFLRLYVPVAAFPLFFAYLALVWMMLTRARRSSLVAASGAGLMFALLVFSYFYLWTTAAAWSLTLFALWLFARPDERRRLLVRFAIVAAFALAALAPYFMLLSRRAANTDAGLLLTRSHQLDPFRLAEIAGAATLLALFIAARRGLVKLRTPETLFAVACALAPFLVFNQQLITGRSLQPFHFGLFSANYLAALGAFLAAANIFRAHAPRRERNEAALNIEGDEVAARNARVARFALVVAMLALSSGAVETAIACRTRFAANALRDDARPAALRLAALARNPSDQNSDAPRPILDTRSLVFAPDYTVADYLPTVAPQPTLWSPHMFNHPGTTLTEDHERLMTWLFLAGENFAGVDPARLDSTDGRRRYLVASLISRERDNPTLRADWQPISSQEARAALDDYARFAAAFTHERAARYPVSYLLLDSSAQFDSTNLERFYERDTGEQLGRFILYRVRLR